MIYRIAVCDDSEADAGYISALAKGWAEAVGARARLDVFSCAEAFLFSYGDNKDYDILLLDIEMGVMDGVSLAREIRRENEAVQIIFITGYSDYILEGYEVSALHYLMKPVDEEKLFEVLNRAAEKLKRNEKVLILEQAGEAVLVPLYEIRYIEVRQNYVTVHAKQDFTVRKTLGEVEKELDERFFRVGRSFIVNLTFVQKTSKTEVFLHGGTRVPLPRGAYEALNRAIISRMFSSG